MSREARLHVKSILDLESSLIKRIPVVFAEVISALELLHQR